MTWTTESNSSTSSSSVHAMAISNANANAPASAPSGPVVHHHAPHAPVQANNVVAVVAEKQLEYVDDRLKRLMRTMNDMQGELEQACTGMHQVRSHYMELADQNRRGTNSSMMMMMMNSSNTARNGDTTPWVARVHMYCEFWQKFTATLEKLAVVKNMEALHMIAQSVWGETNASAEEIFAHGPIMVLPMEEHVVGHRPNSAVAENGNGNSSGNNHGTTLQQLRRMLDVPPSMTSASVTGKRRDRFTPPPTNSTLRDDIVIRPSMMQAPMQAPAPSVPNGLNDQSTPQRIAPFQNAVPHSAHTASQQPAQASSAPSNTATNEPAVNGSTQDQNAPGTESDRVTAVDRVARRIENFLSRSIYVPRHVASAPAASANTSSHIQRIRSDQNTNLPKPMFTIKVERVENEPQPAATASSSAVGMQQMRRGSFLKPMRSSLPMGPSSSPRLQSTPEPERSPTLGPTPVPTRAPAPAPTPTRKETPSKSSPSKTKPTAAANNAATFEDHQRFRELMNGLVGKDREWPLDSRHIEFPMSYMFLDAQKHARLIELHERFWKLYIPRFMEVVYYHPTNVMEKNRCNDSKSKMIKKQAWLLSEYIKRIGVVEVAKHLMDPELAACLFFCTRNFILLHQLSPEELEEHLKHIETPWKSPIVRKEQVSWWEMLVRRERSSGESRKFPLVIGLTDEAKGSVARAHARGELDFDPTWKRLCTKEPWASMLRDFEHYQPPFLSKRKALASATAQKPARSSTSSPARAPAQSSSSSPPPAVTSAPSAASVPAPVPARNDEENIDPSKQSTPDDKEASPVAKKRKLSDPTTENGSTAGGAVASAPSTSPTTSPSSSALATESQPQATASPQRPENEPLMQ